MVSAVDLVNRALQEIGAQTQITSLTDGSGPAQIANIIFNPLYYFLLRQSDWDWARASVTLATTGNAAPAPWTAEFLYPANIARLRYLVPSAADPNDPQPVRFAVGTSGVLMQPNKVIWTNQPPPATAICTMEVPPTTLDYADSIFQETLVRLLGSAFSMASAGRPDYSKFMLDVTAQFEQLGDARPY